MKAEGVSSSFPLSSAVFWYVVAGVAHEMAHCFGFLWAMMMRTDCLPNERQGAFFRYPSSSSRSSFSMSVAMMLLSRRVDANELLTMVPSACDASSDVDGFESAAKFSRFLAVCTSSALFLFSLLLLLKDNNNKENNRAKTFAFAATAFDAICSDVLFDGMSSTTSALLHCGNFGIVLLNAAWCFRNGERAYDLLEKMINVTMMRGAQSGGIVTFEEQSEGKMRGVRLSLIHI